MKTALGLILATAAALPATAQAGDTVTAVLSTANADTASSVTIYELHGLKDIETYLNTAWAMSIKPPQWSYGFGVTVQCMKDGALQAAQV